MSSIYITEPTTKGKVIIKTTLGDIDIELWPKETPKACRNFVQLCMEGYYNGTIFHRVVKGFIAQGGDPTGTGDGGESIYGQPFADEYHSRIRFSHRGMVAMANSGPNTNQSQFFITMDKAPELQGKYTIFGKVTGDSLFNVLKMNDLQVDDNDRPLYPAKIESVSIVWNPFEDIVPRQAKKVVEEVVEKPKTKAQKNYSLLSFGEEAEEEDKELEKTLQNTVAVKSIHAFSNREEERLTAEQLEKKQLEEKLRKQKGKEGKDQPVSEAAEKLKKNTMDAIKRARDTEETSKDEDFQKNMREKMLQKRRRLEKAISEGHEDQEEEEEDEAEEASSSEHEVEAPVVVKNADKLKAIKEQQDKLKQEIKKMGQKDKEDQDEESKVSLIDEQREKYKHMKLYKGRKPDESKVMQMLAKFKQGLHSTSTPSSKSDDSTKPKTNEPVDDEEHEFNSEEDNDDSWKNHIEI